MPSAYPATPAFWPNCPPWPSTCQWPWQPAWPRSPREWCSLWRATTGTPVSSSCPPSACGFSRCTRKGHTAQRQAWCGKRKSCSRARRLCSVCSCWLSSSGCCLWSPVWSGWCLGHISSAGNFNKNKIKIFFWTYCYLFKAMIYAIGKHCKK